jgi:hypothetical protein
MKPKEDFVIGGAIVFVVSVILIFLGGVLGYLTIVAYVVYLLTMVTLTARLARSKKRFYRILAYILCLPLMLIPSDVKNTIRKLEENEKISQ